MISEPLFRLIAVVNRYLGPAGGEETDSGAQN